MRSIDIEALVRWAFREEHADIREDADIDAQTIYWAVIALPDHHSRLVEGHGRAGTRPPRANNSPPVVDLAAYRRDRQEYEDWLEALILLRRVLDGPLSRFRPTGPMIAELRRDRIAG